MEAIQGHYWLKGQDGKPPDKQDGIEYQQSCRVLLPVHRPGIEASFE